MILSNPGFVAAVRERELLPGDEVRDILGPVGDAPQLLRHIVELGRLSYAEAMALWADSFGVGWVDLEATLFQAEVIGRLPREFARRHRVIPLYQLGEAVTLAMADPSDQHVQAAAARHLGAPVSPVCALPRDIDEAIELQYHSFEELATLKKDAALSAALSDPDRPLDEAELKRLSGQPSIIQLVDTLLMLALKEGASDLHIEPFEAHIQLRMRIDGVLRERARIGRSLYQQILSRLKLMAGMDITERRRPQDGRLAVQLPARAIDFRVSTVPALYGEKAVLRVLGQLKRRDAPGLDELELGADNRAAIERLIGYPNGLFFITGPTGSGKTTTLFAALKQINQPGINITTVEDPIEYRLPGITQVAVNRAADVGFAQLLRAFLRQDPDVLLVGEIRDLETARIATEAALTGHLVLATLHTNDAVQAVSRLIDIGVESFMVAPSLLGVMAQRLVRRICPDCRVAYEPDAATLDRLFEREPGHRVPFYRGRGCASCQGSGYRGRLGIHEVLQVDEAIRQRIADHGHTSDLYQAAFASGFTSMRYDGLKKVLRGLTTLEEVERVAPWG